MNAQTKKPTTVEEVIAAALLARIDERTLHTNTELAEVKALVKNFSADLNGVGMRVTKVEAHVESHK